MRRNISPKRLELPESSNLLDLKKYIIYLALLIPIAGNAQFEISYDPITNTMSVNYTGCEICLLGNQTAINICECHNNCEETKPTDEQLERYKGCLKECDEDYADDDSYIHDACLDGCERYLEGIQDECWRDCKEEPEPIRTIIGYSYTLVAAWAPLGQDPRLRMDNWTIFEPPTDVVVGDWVDIPDWNPPSPWPEIHVGNNRCWGIGIRIFYEGTRGRGSCDFTVWECEIVG